MECSDIFGPLSCGSEKRKIPAKFPKKISWTSFWKQILQKFNLCNNRRSIQPLHRSRLHGSTTQWQLRLLENRLRGSIPDQLRSLAKLESRGLTQALSAPSPSDELRLVSAIACFSYSLVAFGLLFRHLGSSPRITFELLLRDFDYLGAFQALLHLWPLMNLGSHLKLACQGERLSHIAGCGDVVEKVSR